MAGGDEQATRLTSSVGMELPVDGQPRPELLSPRSGPLDLTRDERSGNVVDPERLAGRGRREAVLREGCSGLGGR